MKIFGVLLIALVSLLAGLAVGHKSDVPKLVLVQHVVVCNKPQGDIWVASDGESQEAPSGTVVPKGIEQAILSIPCQGDPT